MVTNQVYFSPTFLKSWVHISDNIAGIIGAPQNHWRWHRYNEGEEVLSLCPVSFQMKFYIKRFARFGKDKAK